MISIEIGKNGCPMCNMLGKMLQQKNLTVTKQINLSEIGPEEMDKIISKYQLRNLPVIVIEDCNGNITKILKGNPKDICEEYSKIING